MATEAAGDAAAGPKARIILQQCLSARLQVQPATESGQAEFVQISRGIVVYVCFLKGADRDILHKMVKSVVQTRLSTSQDGKLVSVLELPGDILIVPQATLGGRLKGKVMQYHSNIDKNTGRELYSTFCLRCWESLESNSISKEKGCIVKWGTYGNLQVLNMDTNGPFSHLIEF